MIDFSGIQTASAHQFSADHSSANFDGAVKLESGIVCLSSSKWHNEPPVDGLKIVIIRNSEIHCKLSDCKETQIVGPCICIIWNRGEREGAQSFPAGCNMHYLSVSLKMNSPHSIFGKFINTYDAQLESYTSKGQKMIHSIRREL